MATTKPAQTVKSVKASNGWDEKLTAIAVDLYSASLAAGGPELANDPTGNMEEIQSALKEAGVEKSLQAIRAKLISEKVYQKADAPRKVGGGSSVRKVHFVRALAAFALAEGVIESIDAFDSLEQAKAEPLKALAKLLNVEVTG